MTIDIDMIIYVKSTRGAQYWLHLTQNAILKSVFISRSYSVMQCKQYI